MLLSTHSLINHHRRILARGLRTGTSHSRVEEYMYAPCSVHSTLPAPLGLAATCCCRGEATRQTFSKLHEIEDTQRSHLFAVTREDVISCVCQRLYHNHVPFFFQGSPKDFQFSLGGICFPPRYHTVSLRGADEVVSASASCRMKALHENRALHKNLVVHENMKTLQLR